jgi:hypothetical protein
MKELDENMKELLKNITPTEKKNETQLIFIYLKTMF